MTHHHHHHHHDSSGGNGLASLLAIILLVLLGLVAWGCVELGFALGLGGGVAFLAGAGIVLGGVVAAVAVGIGICAFVDFCKHKYAAVKAARPVSEAKEQRSNNATIHGHFSSGYQQTPTHESSVTQVDGSVAAPPSVNISGANDHDSVRITPAKNPGR